MPRTEQQRDRRKWPPVWKTTGIGVGVVFSFISLLSYYDKFVDQGIYAVFEELISKYREAVYFCFGWLDPYFKSVVQIVASYCGWRLELQPYWKDVFIPIGLFFASSARATHGDGRAMYRNVLLGVGMVFALGTSIALASSGTELMLAPAVNALTLGVVLYELMSYWLLLRLVEEKERASSPSFGRYVLERPVPSIGLGALAYYLFSRFADNEDNAALALVFYIFLLGLRSIALAIIFALENRGGWPGTFRDRLVRSRSGTLGFLVVGTITAATWCIVLEG